MIANPTLEWFLPQILLFLGAELAEIAAPLEYSLLSPNGFGTTSVLSRVQTCRP